MRFILCCAICLCLAALIPHKREPFSVPGVRDLGGARLHYAASQPPRVETPKQPRFDIGFYECGRYYVYAPKGEHLAYRAAVICHETLPVPPESMVVWLHVKPLDEWEVVCWPSGRWHVHITGPDAETIERRLRSTLRAVAVPRRTFEGEGPE